MKNKTISRIAKMTKPHIGLIIVTTILAIIVDVLVLFRPQLVKFVINEFLEKGVSQSGIFSTTIVAYLYMGIVLIENVLDYYIRTRTYKIGELVIYDIRNKLFKKMEHSKISFHDKTPAGTLFVRIVSDVEDIYVLFSDVITTVVKDIFIMIGLIIVMVCISIKLSIASFIVIPIIIIISLIMSKVMNNIYEKMKKARTKLNIFFSESIYGIKVIKIFNRQKEKQKECENIAGECRKMERSLGFFKGAIPGLIMLAENLGVAIVIFAVINNFCESNLDIGTIYVFITYLRNIFDPVNRIVENVEIIEDAVTSIDKVFEIIENEDTYEDLDSGISMPKIKGKIEFKHVWFAYKNEDWVLKDVSFTIKPGENVALVGKTGSGKTTITNLINKFYTIQKGEILIDGVNINDIKISDLRRNIGTILQDPFIYATSIKNNIKLFNDISDEQVKEALELSSASNFVNKLPNGINEIAHERGNSFSAGEKQLLAFARIFALQPSIFILDEATANIDTTTEQLIQQSIDKISKNNTSIFIAHRLATIVNVDKIIVIDKGKIAEQGSHNELVRSGGYYSKLYKAYYESLAGC